MKRMVALVILVLVVGMIGAQQAQLFCEVLVIDLTRESPNTIKSRINTYLRQGYEMISASVYRDELIIIFQIRI